MREKEQKEQLYYDENGVAEVTEQITEHTLAGLLNRKMSKRGDNASFVSRGNRA
ncbi:hypothetical protein LR68_02414 [Anoxybacillus sp. BCO1]|nr:hypothetical protein LR68_02414 [Anoxybacillus sp. BCO1]